MSHVDDGALNAFLDGELDDDGCAALERHVHDCPACGARLEAAARARALASALLVEAGVEADTAPPWETLVARAGRVAAGAAPEPETLPSASELRPPLVARRGWLRGLAWAATLVLAFAIGWQARQVGMPGSAPEPVAVGGTTGEALRDAASEASEAAQPEFARFEAAQAESAAPGSPAPAPSPLAATPGDAIGAGLADGPMFQPVDLDEAAGRLGAPPLLPPATRVRAAAIGPDSALEGALPGRDVLRLELTDADGFEVTLLQQYDGSPRAAADQAGMGARAASVRRAPAESRLQAAAAPAGTPEPARLQADPLSVEEGFDVSVAADGARRLRWLHPAGYLLVLESTVLDEAQLLALARSLR